MASGYEIQCFNNVVQDRVDEIYGYTDYRISPHALYEKSRCQVSISKDLMEHIREEIGPEAIALRLCWAPDLAAYGSVETKSSLEATHALFKPSQDVVDRVLSIVSEVKSEHAEWAHIPVELNPEQRVQPMGAF